MTGAGDGRQRRRTLRACLPLLAALLLCGCLDSLKRSRRDPGSVLWVSPDSAPLPVEDRDRLQPVGIRELFVEVGELEWSAAGLEVRSLPEIELPRRTVATLVIGGDWTARGVEPEPAAEQLAASLRQLKIVAEGRGLLPLGFHFHVGGVRDLSSFGAVLRSLAGELERGMLLSATIDVGWLDDAEVEKVIQPLHYFATFLYGQRSAAREEGRFWDLEKIGASLARLEELDRDYLVGVVGEGSLQLLGRDGEVIETVAAEPLRTLVGSPKLEADAAFLFEGFHRQVIDFEAQRPIRFGAWELRTGERLRVARPTAYHLAELRRRLAGMELDGYLGELYYRLPPAAESQALSLDQMLAALRPSPPLPDLVVGADLVRDRSSRWTVRLNVANRGDLETGVAAVDHNYVEARVDGGAFVRVGLGDFKRMELSSRGRAATSMRGVREADAVRLFYPLLDPGWAASSGPIELDVEGRDTELLLRAAFLLPDGRTHEVTRSWNPYRTEVDEATE